MSLPPLRIGIPFLLLSFGGLAGVTAYIYDRKAQNELIEQESALYVKYLGEKFGGMISYLMEVEQPVGAQREVALTGTRPGARFVTILDGENRVLISSREEERQMVESFGFRVDVACDGLEAVELFKKADGKYRAVLMDLTMPRLDGEAASRRLHALDPNVRLVLMSGFNEQEATQRFAGTGLSGFLQKPFKLDQLAAKLSSVLAES